ncbi:hypothetical protein CYY_000924 [Polysphondylium violaceum]|uniref:Anaphase-promoting complex subunit 13 n=1 Tax=Polysphondylium violaceum TaxID=133409 RepID=A0A8J4V560_9MYCE|nr:hypothetical protein CYY_000924 [Polysphondylium violaceum]
MDSSFSLYIHGNGKLIDIIDQDWSKQTLPNEALQHPAMNESILNNDEFDELLKKSKQSSKSTFTLSHS